MAARRGAPACPVPPRAAGGSLGCGAPFCSCPTFALSCRRGTPPSLPCHLCPSALRPARARCGAIRVAALPLCPPSLPRPPGPVLPPVCSPSLVLPCPPSHAPGPLSPCPRPPFTPLTYTSRSNTRGIPPTPSSPCRPLVPWSLGLWHARRTAPACGLCPSTPALPPPPSPALFPLGHYAGHCVGKSQARRRHVAGTHLASIGGVVGLVGTTMWPPAAATAPAGAAAAGSHSKCRGGRGPGRPRLPPGQGFTAPAPCPPVVLWAPDCTCCQRSITLRLPAAATAPAGAAAAGGRSKCRGGRGPSRPRLPPGQGFTVPPAAPGRRGGSIKSSCKRSKKNRHIYIYIYIYIYLYIYISSNLHPSPNSRWLHHTALRYVRRAQSGAYMWWKAPNSVKTGSKWAKNTCLSIPNGPGSLLEKRVFDPFLTHFWSQNGPFSRHFGSFQEPKPVATDSKWAKTTCLSIINGPGSFLEKRVFDPFLTHCWS